MINLSKYGKAFERGAKAYELMEIFPKLEGGEALKIIKGSEKQ